MSPTHNEPIAIIGNACRFPGDATSPSKLWELLKDPREVSRQIDRFEYAGWFNKDGHYHGASNVQDSYLLSEDPRLFDAQFFNIPPGEAESIDPQQRILLETVYEAIESSGLALENLKGSNTAVYVGVMCDDYGNICYVDPEAIPTYAATGTARSILSNRVSFVFDWRGPSMTIDTACSSSLVALHQGVQVLRSGSSNVAVAAGANLIFSPNMFIAESNLNMLSPSGKSQMWDANADGYARGEGMAAVIMKRLSDAIADGDHIECIIRETGVNQDGHTPGITMPSQEAQTRLIHDTYRRAGLDLSVAKDRPQYFEAHGTGTKAGDGVESKAIYKAFFGDKDAETHSNLWVGSIKTVIGHTEGTAGIAGVMKASLAIQNKTIPPNLHLHNLNPEIAPFYGKVQIAQSAQDWPALPEGGVRRASINSFGFGGTNAHAIIEAYEPNDAPAQAVEQANSLPLPLTFSATSEKTLTNLMSNFLDFITENSEVDLNRLAWTLHDRRSTFTYRNSVVGQTREDLIAKLQKAVEDPQHVRGLTAKKNLLGVFSGQGAQWATMGRDIIAASKFAEDIIDKLEQSLNELPAEDRPSWSLKAQMMIDAAESRIGEGELSQPLCTAVQVMLVDMLKAAGIVFDTVVGHSSGEIGAAYAAGFISAHDAIRIAFYRGRYAYLARGPAGQRGGMLAAGTTLEDARELCALPAFEGRVSVAAYNSSSSVTLSGDLDAIEHVKDVLEDEKKFNRQLKVDTAYHSHHMIPCSKKYYEALDACKIEILKPSGETKWFSSVYDGKVMEQCDALKHQYWVDNMVNIVLFATALESDLNSSEPNPTQAIEVGPHAALKGPASSVIEETLKSALPYTGTLARGQNDVDAVASTFGYLWSRFGRSAADLKAYAQLFNKATPTPLRELPSYPFNHDRVFWYESRKSRVNRLREDPAHILLGTRTDTANEREYRWRNYIHAGEIPWLQGHKIQGQTLFPAAGFLAMAIEAARFVGRAEAIQAIELHDSAIHRALAIADDKGIETLFALSNVSITETGEETSVLSATFSCDACLGKSETFVSIASGKLVMTYGTPSSTALVKFPVDAGHGMLDVDTELFYAYLASIGYNYDGLFKGITSMQRTTSLAQGEICTSLPEEENLSKDAFLLHPSTLDVAFQAIFAAISYPGDNALWALHIPTTIRRIVLNPAICPFNGGIDQKVRFSATSNRSDDGSFSGCVDIFPADSEHSLCQVEGLEVSPVSPPTEKDDRGMFGKTTRWLSSPDADAFATPLELSAKQEQEKQQLDRLAVNYLRKIFNSSSAEQAHLRLWAQNVLTSIGSKSWAKEAIEDAEDVSLEANSICQPTLDILKSVGDSIDYSIVSEDGTDNASLLSKFYESAIGAAEARQTLAALTRQMSQRYPHMRIMELGTGSGSTTKAVLPGLGALFNSYTCTDATSDNFEALTHEHGDNIFTETIDFEQDLEEQGFTAASVDLIVAGAGLHMLKDREAGLNKLRWLLRPGGFLLVQQLTNAESVHVGLVAGTLIEADDVSQAVPALGEYDQLLQSTGFSGIDTVTPDSANPFSVFVSQAVDQQMNAIRAPLTSNTSIDQILLIGGQRFQISRMIETIKSTLAPFCDKITAIKSIDDLDGSMLAARPLVLSLTELDEPFFQNLTEHKFKALQTLFFRSRYIVWANHGANGANPYANVMKGVVRCLIVEIPHLHGQMFNIEGRLKPEQHAQELAESLLRLHIADGWKDKVPAYSPLWTSERELMLENDKLFVTRYDPEKTLNDHYNALRRNVVSKTSTKDNVIAITATKNLQQYRLTPHIKPEADPAESATVVVKHSASTALKVGDIGCFFLSIGTVKETGATALVFSEHHQSVVIVPKTRLVTVDVTEANERALLMSVATQLTASAILQKCSAGDKIVLHEPATVLAQLITEQTAKIGAQAVFTTTDKATAEVQGWKHVHAFSVSRDLNRIITPNTTLFANFAATSEAGDVADRLVSFLPFRARRHTAAEYFPTQSIVFSDTTEEQIVGALNAANTKAAEAKSAVNFGAVEQTMIHELAADSSLGAPLTTMDWTDSTSFDASVTLAMEEVTFRSDRTYFLIGMTGSLGLSTVQYMMERGARHFALSSRRPNLDKIFVAQAEENFGADIRGFALDITSRADLHRVHKEICDSMPPIAGVANAALIMRDGLFMESTAETMNQALAPKIDGSIYLDELFCKPDLDFFILYSSLVYITGNIGQTSYAAGNGFMVSLCHGRRQRGLVGSVMNLGGINGIGYITRTDHNILSRLDILGYGIMSELDYKYFFAESVMAGGPDSGRDPEVSAGLRFVNPKTEKSPPKWVEDPKFNHYVLDRSGRDSGEKGGDGALSTKAQLLEAATPKDAFNIILGALMVMLAKKLDLPPTESIHSDVAIVEMGVDSLVAVDMRSWFSNQFDHDIPIIKILGGATLADLVEDTVDNLSADICPNLAGAAPEEAAEPAAAEAEVPNDNESPTYIVEDEGDSTDSDTPDDATISTDLDEPAEPSSSQKPQVQTQSKAVEKAVVAAQPAVPALKFVRTAKMTHGCSRFWFLRQYLEEPNCFNVLVQSRLSGNVDVTRVQEAVRKVGLRHESLRTAYYSDDKGNAMMGVLSDSLLRLELQNASSEAEAKEAFKKLSAHDFDIERGEVIRVRLVTLAPNDHIIMFAVHHIAMDGFSFNLMLRDLDMLYQGKPVPQIPLQFTDFAIQQRKDIEAGRMRSDVTFWKKAFASLPDPLPLFPLADVGARNALVKYEHEEVELVLDNATSKQIRELCRKNRCTAFHFFLASFQVFLSRWLSVDDFCIGIADANRKDLKTLSTVGFLLNLIPLRFGALPKKASFATVLAAAKQNAYSALSHSALPFDLLLEELNMPRSSSHSPLFQAFLDYRQLAVKTPPLLQSKAEGESNFGATAYDVVLDVTDVASADLTIKWQTQKSLYSKRHTETMMNSYMHLIRQFIKDFSAPVDGVTLYRPEDIKSAVDLGRGPQFDSEWTETLSQKVDQVSAQFPQDIALRDGLGNELTYAAMNRTIDQISEELVNANVKAGDKVGIFQQPGAPWICSLLATWRSGAVYVPLDPRNGLARLGATASVVEPAAIICDDSVAKDVSDISSTAQVINVDQVRKANATVTRRPNLATRDGSAIIVSSSGSTGVPKCIEVRHNSLLNLFEGDSKNWTLGRPNALQQSAYSFDISMDQIFTGLVNGGTLYVASEEQRSHPEGIANIIANNNITYTMATPSEYSNWINYAAPTMSKGTSWRLANIGGEGWNSTLRDSFATLNLPNLKIQNCYGPAESSVWTTRLNIEYPAETTLIPAGPALANYSLYILDNQSNVVPAGVTGEILIGGAGTAVGYYKNTELTQEKFILDKNASPAHVAKGWNRAYRTGDKGYLMDNGNLVVQGRITGDTQIKLRGFRIELEDIENTITRASDGVLTRVVASVRGEGQSSFLAAFAEFAEGFPAEKQQAYLNKLLSTVPLPQYMKPNMMLPVDRIPLNSHNKVNRLVIATFPVHSESSTEETDSTERTATEDTVWKLWKEILPESVMRNASANANSDFFQLGGNSLLTVRLQARIRDSFGLFIPLVRIIESSTLSRLASTLDALMSDTEIDWEAETAIPSDMISMSTKHSSTPTKTSNLTVVLTGASGFIGRHILQRLIADKNVTRIHCVAHRDLPAELPTRQKLNAVLNATSKVTVHGGDLEAPLLGLSEAEFANLAGEADLIIHSGANRSFWTAYESVRAANVQSTKELARLAAVALRDHKRVVPFHFLSGSEALASDPENDGSNGYVASKWASERFLEKFSKHFALPVHMHRQLPVPGGREAVDQELDDILQEFVDVAARMPELPDSNAWRGHYDLIPADRLAEDVIDQAMGGLKTNDDTTHQHSHYSSVRMDIAKVLKRLETIPEYTDSDRPRIPAHVWIGKAKIEGFRYQFSTMAMSLTDGEGKSMAMLTR
ncbi:hypothetical protein VHEMI09637 [[Torrubiella] hemipterigena]|uniref:Carrier domain-containing protein n=1 Tax=[Torrubiella] hemipterigena TaxID=1531966 RepID=A0A0A1TQN7_9HYPO|nr:hypothetical protein VHEMI09637 [[Torrubiella] hemipterigena]